MNRHSFLWPVAADRVKAVVNALPNCVYFDPVEAGAPSFQPEVWYRFADGVDSEGATRYSVMRCWVIQRIAAIAIPHLGASAGTAQKWDVFQMVPRHIEKHDGTITRPRNLGTKVMNMLGRYILNHADLNTNAQGETWTGRPMSFAEVLERYPAAAARYLKPQQDDGEGGTEPVPGSLVQLSPTPADTDPVEGAAVDYRPTDGQLQADADVPVETWPEDA